VETCPLCDWRPLAPAAFLTKHTLAVQLYDDSGMARSCYSSVVPFTKQRTHRAIRLYIHIEIVYFSCGGESKHTSANCDIKDSHVSGGRSTAAFPSSALLKVAW
jgi:hypothetical protein